MHGGNLRKSNAAWKRYQARTQNRRYLNRTDAKRIAGKTRRTK